MFVGSSVAQEKCRRSVFFWREQNDVERVDDASKPVADATKPEAKNCEQEIDDKLLTKTAMKKHCNGL